MDEEADEPWCDGGRSVGSNGRWELLDDDDEDEDAAPPFAVGCGSRTKTPMAGGLIMSKGGLLRLVTEVWGISRAEARFKQRKKCMPRVSLC